jgi:hypothetical protein
MRVRLPRRYVRESALAYGERVGELLKAYLREIVVPGLDRPSGHLGLSTAVPR